MGVFHLELLPFILKLLIVYTHVHFVPSEMKCKSCSSCLYLHATFTLDKHGLSADNRYAYTTIVKKVGLLCDELIEIRSKCRAERHEHRLDRCLKRKTVGIFDALKSEHQCVECAMTFLTTFLHIFEIEGHFKIGVSVIEFFTQLSSVVDDCHG